MPYQARWGADKSRVRVIEKSRRVGISWASAAIAALNAAKRKGRDRYYVGYNREMAEQFIEDVAWWAKAYQLVTSTIEQEVLHDDDKDILVYRVRFASGYKVQALSSKPSNLRAKKGDITIDEFAFHEQPDELLKAALATLMWGYNVEVISTHNGVGNHFNQLCTDIRAGKLDYSLHQVTLDDAIADGLYKRICLINNWEWSKELQTLWREQLYRDYGIGADEELGCIPLDVKGGGKVFNRAWFPVVDSVPEGGRIVRFWDLAASKGALSFFTAGVKMKSLNGEIYVLDAIAEQLSPAEANELIVAVANQDGKNCMVRWELEGGSAGLRDESHLRELLKGFNARGVKPQGDKVMRAKPLASEVKQGRVKLLRGNWNDRYIGALHDFDGGSKPLVNDLTDASSGGYAVLKTPRVGADFGNG